MKKYWVLIVLFLLASCGSRLNVKPDAELKGFSSQKLLELAAGEYVNYQYDAAVYYYKKLIELFPNDVENKTWANYEIGFIYFKKNQYVKAQTYFDEVLSQDSTMLVGAQVLASKMKAVILQKQKKSTLRPVQKENPEKSNLEKK